MSKTVIMSGPQNFLYEMTYYRAVHNVCKQHGLNFKFIQQHDVSGEEYVKCFEPDDSAVFHFHVYNPGYNTSIYHALKNRLPNAKFAGIGGDMMYYGTKLNWPCDVFIDYTQYVNDGIARDNPGCKTYTIHWTFSVEIIKIIQQYFQEHPEMSKEYDFVCPFRCDVGIRPDMFKQISDLGMTYVADMLIGSLNYSPPFRDSAYDDRIYNLIPYYTKAWFILGTSTSVFGHGPRSMKGLRDYMAPLCGCAMLFDDYPEMVELASIIPIYPYGDYKQLHQILLKYTSNLVDYMELVDKQKTWVLNHTMEATIENILRGEQIL